MTPSPIDSYLERLRRELQRHFIVDSRIIQEVRDHFSDALDGGHNQDGSLAAEARAIERFGSPELVAAAFVADRTRNLHRSLLVAATVAGIAIAFVDARATWDDAGITAGAMLLVAVVLGLLGPQRPWLWALAVGMWIPTYALVRAPAFGAVAMLLVLIFPLAGAYVGRIARSLLLASNF